VYRTLSEVEGMLTYALRRTMTMCRRATEPETIPAFFRMPLSLSYAKRVSASVPDLLTFLADGQWRPQRGIIDMRTVEHIMHIVRTIPSLTRCAHVDIKTKVMVNTGNLMMKSPTTTKRYCEFPTEIVRI
jgi:hypothetical protein